MSSPLVSVIIPVHNRPGLLQQAVESVQAQTYQKFEIIIVDDGSDDLATRARCRALEQAHREIQVVWLPQCGGAGAAREAGRQRARGEFIQYLDSDDLLLPSKFEWQLDALQGRPECDVAYGVTRLIDAQGETLAEPYKWSGRKFDALFPALLVDRWWNTQTPLWRRTLCDRIGPWPALSMSEDWVYDARAGALRAKLAYVDATVAATRQHAGTRITGGGMSVDRAESMAELLRELLRCGRLAGVDEHGAEWRHLVRWLFAHARRCGALGCSKSARELYRLACLATDTPDLKMRLVGACAAILGWRITGNVCRAIEQAGATGGRSDTLRQSWVDPCTPPKGYYDHSR